MTLSYKSLLFCLVFLTGCSKPTVNEQPDNFFDVTLSSRVGWADEYSGYDADNSAYYLRGDIGSISLQARSEKLPKQLQFFITTSPSLQPMLEGLTLTIGDVELNTSSKSQQLDLHNKRDGSHLIVERDEYLKFELTSQYIHISLTPKAMALMTDGLTLFWVDWYR